MSLYLLKSSIFESESLWMIDIRMILHSQIYFIKTWSRITPLKFKIIGDRVFTIRLHTLDTKIYRQLIS